MSFQILMEFKSCFVFVVIIVFGGGFFYCVIFVTVFIQMLFNECTYFVWSENLWCFQWIMSCDWPLKWPVNIRSAMNLYWIYLMSEFPSHALVYFKVYKVRLLNLSHLLLILQSFWYLKKIMTWIWNWNWQG